MHISKHQKTSNELFLAGTRSQADCVFFRDCVPLSLSMVLGTTQLQIQLGPLWAAAELIINNNSNVSDKVML